jgi:hypothetical protein
MDGGAGLRDSCMCVLVGAVAHKVCTFEHVPAPLGDSELVCTCLLRRSIVSYYMMAYCAHVHCDGHQVGSCFVELRRCGHGTVSLPQLLRHSFTDSTQLLCVSCCLLTLACTCSRAAAAAAAAVLCIVCLAVCKAAALQQHHVCGCG